jgi:hypothetical protein
MKSILDNFEMPKSSFRPKTTTDLFALILALKLGDPKAVRHYAQLAIKNSQDQMIFAFKQAMRTGETDDKGRRFHQELENVNSNISNGNGSRLIAIRVERRSIAAAIFSGERLEYCQVRQLPSDKDKVIGSAVRFIVWMTSQFSPDSAAIEAIPNGNEIQRRSLTVAIVKVMRERMLPIWEVAKRDLFWAYGCPPLRCRRELREVIADMWPVLLGTKSKTFIQDAVALGLYVQIERLFLY